jgi:porphobilinogen deaminase
MTPLPTRVMLPAPAQGALAVECRATDPLADHLAVLDDPRARLEVTAERAVLTGVEATCTTAIGALARWESGALTLRAELTEDGTRSHTHAEHSRTLANEHDLDGAPPWVPRWRSGCSCDGHPDRRGPPPWPRRSRAAGPQRGGCRCAA